MPPKSGKKLSKAEKEKQKKEMEEKQEQEREEARLAAEKEDEERKAREAVEAEERKRLETAERKKRKGQLQELEDLWSSYRNTLEEEKRQRRVKAKWDRYMLCDGSPDPTIPGEINTYMNLWRENVKDRDIQVVLKESKLILSLIDELDFLIEDTPPEELTEDTVTRFRETIGELRGLLKKKLDLATHDLLLKATDLMDSETMNLQRVITDNIITLCVWGNLSKNPRIKSFEFEEVGIMFEMPKLLTLSDIAFRILITQYDHLSPLCSSYHARLKQPRDPEEEKAAAEEVEGEGEKTAEGEEGEEGEKKEEGEEGMMTREETEDVMAQLRQLEDGEEADDGEKQPEASQEEVVEEDDYEIKTPEPKEFEDFDGDDDVIDLRAYEVLGGIVYFNLLNMPPQPKVANTWTITQLVDPPALDINNYEGDAPPETPKESDKGEDITKAADKLLNMKMDVKKDDEPKKKEAEKPDIPLVYNKKTDGKAPIGIKRELPPTVYFSEEPQVARWDEKSKCWRVNGFTEQTFNEEERTYSFKTRFFGTLALVQDKHINMPFQSWEIRPRAANHVLVTIIAAIVEVEFEIKDNQVRLIAPEDRPELSHLLNKYMHHTKFVQAMKAAGINLFPDEDSHKYVSIQNKNSITEERLYQQMAMTCSGMAYSWSRWNTDVQDLQKLVIQGCEQTVDEPLLEVTGGRRIAKKADEDWSLFLITKKRTTKLKMTEFDETFSEDHAEGTEFHADLYHMTMDIVGENAKERIRQTNHLFVDAVYSILKATNIITYS